MPTSFTMEPVSPNTRPEKAGVVAATDSFDNNIPHSQGDVKRIENLIDKKTDIIRKLVGKYAQMHEAAPRVECTNWITKEGKKPLSDITNRIRMGGHLIIGAKEV